MGVLGYQVTVVATVAFSGRYRWVVSGGWAVWTIALVFTPWLIGLQLGSIVVGLAANAALNEEAWERDPIVRIFRWSQIPSNRAKAQRRATISAVAVGGVLAAFGVGALLTKTAPDLPAAVDTGVDELGRRFDAAGFPLPDLPLEMSPSDTETLLAGRGVSLSTLEEYLSGLPGRGWELVEAYEPDPLTRVYTYRDAGVDVIIEVSPLPVLLIHAPRSEHDSELARPEQGNPYVDAAAGVTLHAGTPDNISGQLAETGFPFPTDSLASCDTDGGCLLVVYEPGATGGDVVKYLRDLRVNDWTLVSSTKGVDDQDRNQGTMVFERGDHARVEFAFYRPQGREELDFQAEHEVTGQWVFVSLAEPPP